MVTRVPIIYELNTAQAQRNAAGLVRQMGELRQETTRLDASGNQLQGRVRGISGSFSALRASLPVVAITAVGAAVVTVQDRMAQLQNRLRPVTADARELGQVFDLLDNVALDTRSTIDQSIESYARLRVSTRDLGLSVEETSELVRTLNNLQLVSVSSTDEARNAIRQFNQALASGRFQGDELRSVLENLPDLARIIAEELGVTIGQLRDLGAAGELTSDVLIRALSGAGDEVEALAQNQVPTLGQAFSVLVDQVADLAGRFNEASGGGNVLATAILNLAQKAEDAEPFIERLGRQVRSFFDDVRALGSSDVARAVLGLAPVNQTNQGRGPDVRVDSPLFQVNRTGQGGRLDSQELADRLQRFRPQGFPVNELIRRQDEAARSAERLGRSAEQAARRATRESESAAEQIAETYSRGFDAAGEAITRFVQRGEFELRDFLGLALDLINNSGIGDALAQAFGFGGQSSGSSLGGNFLSTLIGGFGGGPTNIVPAGGSSFTSGSFGTFLGGFQTGGDIMATGSGGPDSVRFTADVSPGERVRFIPPGQGGEGASTVNITNIFQGVDPRERGQLERLLDARDAALRQQTVDLVRNKASRQPAFLRPRGA